MTVTIRTPIRDLLEELQPVVGPVGLPGASGPAGDDGSVGARGATGAPGKSLLHGNGAPSLELGVNGEFYLDLDSYRLYGPKTSLTWGSGISLVGPQGPSGGITESADAGESISALRAVRYDGTSLVYCRPNELASLAPLGISTTSATVGDPVTVQTEGRMYDASWNWTVGQAVLVGTNGALTQSQPVGQQYMIPVGFAIASNAMMVRISVPILLSL